MHGTPFFIEHFYVTASELKSENNVEADAVDVLPNKSSQKSHKFHRKTPALEFHFHKVQASGLQLC